MFISIFIFKAILPLDTVDKLPDLKSRSLVNDK